MAQLIFFFIIFSCKNPWLIFVFYFYMVELHFQGGWRSHSTFWHFKHTYIHTQEKGTLMFQFGITVLSLYKLVKIQGKIYSKHRVTIKYGSGALFRRLQCCWWLFLLLLLWRAFAICSLITKGVIFQGDSTAWALFLLTATRCSRVPCYWRYQCEKFSSNESWSSHDD